MPLGLIVALAPLAVQLVEGIFHKARPEGGAGADKLDVVAQILRIVTDKLAQGPGQQPLTDDALRGVIESSVAQMKAAQQMPTPGASVAQTTGESMYLLIGGRIVPLVVDPKLP
jgi:hypothetical protein